MEQKPGRETTHGTETWKRGNSWNRDLEKRQLMEKKPGREKTNGTKAWKVEDSWNTDLEGRELMEQKPRRDKAHGTKTWKEENPWNINLEERTAVTYTREQEKDKLWTHPFQENLKFFQEKEEMEEGLPGH